MWYSIYMNLSYCQAQPSIMSAYFQLGWAEIRTVFPSLPKPHYKSVCRSGIYRYVRLSVFKTKFIMKFKTKIINTPDWSSDKPLDKILFELNFWSSTYSNNVLVAVGMKSKAKLKFKRKRFRGQKKFWLTFFRC